MSELTPCNYCNLNRIKRRAKSENLKVTTKRDDHNWISIYVHPPDVIDLTDEYRVASMMKITDHCVC